MSLHIETPLIESLALSRRLDKPVWLKMEALQPTGSFKARGIGHACTIHQQRGASRLVSSSGGNAGLAVAYTGRKLGMPVLVVVPQTTTARARELIGMEGAQIVVHGKSWQEANDYALASIQDTDAFIHPFDDPLLWQGHASMIDEVARSGVKPGAVILSVGGGGLLCGVVEGLQRNGWHDVPVIAAETRGADSYARALEAGRRVELDAITSIATSLGAQRVCAQALDNAQQHRIESVVVTDAEAVAGSIRLLDEHRVLVEPACGASVAALDTTVQALAGAASVLVIVCGGVGISASQLQRWRVEYGV